jgi:hypothetical protein
MDIGNAKVAVGVSVKLFDDIIKSLHQRNIKFQRIAFEEEITIIEQIKAKIHMEFDIDPPELEYESQGNNKEPLLLLNMGGKAKPKISFAGKTSDVLFEIPFSASAAFRVVIRHPDPAKAPVMGLDFLGVKNVSEPFNDALVNKLIAETEYVKLIEDFQLNILEPVISGIEAVYFADPLGVNSAPLPSHGSYPVVLRHMFGRSGTIDAISVFFGLPNESLAVGLVPSFVPSGSEIFIHVSEGMLQSMVDKFKDELKKWVESQSSSCKVSNVALTIQDNAISVSGKVKETDYDATGTVTGKFHFNHRPGLNKIVLDGSDIDIDIDLPWWADMLLVIFFPVGIVVYSEINQIEEDVPEIGQKMIGRMFNDMMDKLAASINLENLSIGGIPVEVYTDTIKLDNKALSIKIQILIQPITETIVRADYGKILGRFVYFYLESGRQFRTEDLIRFIGMNLIKVPGYQVVGGKYIRSIPDNTMGNNLLERWGR